MPRFDSSEQTVTPVFDRVATKVLDNIYKYLKDNKDSGQDDGRREIIERLDRLNDTADDGFTARGSNDRATQAALKGILGNQKKEMASNGKDRATQRALFGKMDNTMRNSSKMTSDAISKMSGKLLGALGSLKNFLGQHLNRTIQAQMELQKIMRLNFMTSAQKDKVNAVASSSIGAAKQMFGMNLAMDEVTQYMSELVVAGKDLELMGTEQATAFAALRKMGIDENKAYTLAMSANAKDLQRVVTAAADPKVRASLTGAINGMEDYELAVGGISKNLNNLTDGAQAAAKTLGTTAIATGKSADIVRDFAYGASGQLEKVSGNLAAVAGGVHQSADEHFKAIDQSLKSADDIQRRAMGAMGDEMMTALANASADKAMMSAKGNKTEQGIRSDKENKAALATNTKDGKLQQFIDQFWANLDKKTGGKISQINRKLDEWFGGSTTITQLAGGVAGSLLLLGKSILSGGLVLGKFILNGVKNAISGAGNFIRKGLSSIPKIATAVKDGIVSVVKGVKNVVGGVTSAIGNLGTNIKNGFNAATDKIKSISQGVKSSHNDEPTSKLGKVARSIGDTLKTAGKVTAAGIKAAGNAAKSALKSASKGFGSALKSAGKVVAKGLRTAGSAAAKGLRAAGRLGKAAGGLVGGAALLGGISALAKNIQSEGPSFVRDMINTAVDFIKNDLPTVIKALIDALPELVTAITDELPGIVSMFVDNLPIIIKAITDALPNVISALTQQLPRIITALCNALPQVITAIVQNLPTIITAIVNSLPTIITAICEALPTIITAICEALPTIITAICDALPQIITAICDALPQIISAIIDALPKIIVAICESLPKIIVTICEKIPDIITAVISKIPDIIVALVEHIPDIVKAIVTALGSGLGNMMGSIADKLGLVDKGGHAVDNSKTLAEQKRINDIGVKRRNELAKMDQSKLMGIITELAKTNTDVAANLKSGVYDGRSSEELANAIRWATANQDKAVTMNDDGSFNVDSKYFYDDAKFNQLINSAVPVAVAATAAKTKTDTEYQKAIGQVQASATGGGAEVNKPKQAKQPELPKRPTKITLDSVYDLLRNNILSVLNKIATLLDMPKYAQGTVTDKATRAVIGEAGKEAVLPLTKPLRVKEIISQLTEKERASIKAAIDSGATADQVGEYTNALKQLSEWKGGRLKPAAFFELFGPIAREDMRATGIPASVTLAQAALESGWGKTAKTEFRNLFGIKGTGDAGAALVTTHEDRGANGREVKKDYFAQYSSYLESIKAHSRYLLEAKRKRKGLNGLRYGEALTHIFEPNLFAYLLRECGYATSSGYGGKLVGLMKGHNLYKWDVGPGAVSFAGIGSPQIDLLKQAKENLKDASSAEARMQTLLSEEQERLRIKAEAEGKTYNGKMMNVSAGVSGADNPGSTAEQVASSMSQRQLDTLDRIFGIKSDSIDAYSANWLKQQLNPDMMESERQAAIDKSAKQLAEFTAKKTTEELKNGLSAEEQKAFDESINSTSDDENIKLLRSKFYATQKDLLTKGMGVVAQNVAVDKAVSTSSKITEILEDKVKNNGDVLAALAEITRYLKEFVFNSKKIQPASLPARTNFNR